MAGWKEELGLENVSPFSRPMTSGPNDVFVREDELGNKTYRTLLGQEYTIRPATPEESKTTRTRVEDWAKTGMPLPSGEQVLEAVKNIPSEAINSVDRVMKGEGTVGEAIGFVPATGALAAVGSVGKAVDPTVARMFFGAPKNVAEEATKMLDSGFTEQEIAGRLGVWQDPKSQKWLVETDDSNFDITPYARVQGAVSNPRDINLTPIDKAISGTNILNDIPELQSYNVGIVQPEMFKAWNFPDGTMGVHDRDFEQIFTLRDDDRSTVLHEIQHAVDSIELRDAGANPDKVYADLAQVVDNLPNEAKLWLNAKESLSATEQNISSSVQERNAYLKRIESGIFPDNVSSQERVDQLTDFITQEKGRRNELKSSIKEVEQYDPDLYKNLEQLQSKLKTSLTKLNEAAHPIYERNEGETRARIVQARADMKPEERYSTNNPLKATEETWSQYDLTKLLRNVQNSLDQRSGIPDPWANVGTPTQGPNTSVVPFPKKGMSFDVYYDAANWMDFDNRMYTRPSEVQNKLYKETISFTNPLVVKTKKEAAERLGVPVNQIKYAAQDRNYDGIVIQDKNSTVKDFIDLRADDGSWTDQRATRVTKDTEKLANADFSHQDFVKLQNAMEGRINFYDAFDFPETDPARQADKINNIIYDLKKEFPEWADEIEVDPEAFITAVEERSQKNTPRIEETFRPQSEPKFAEGGAVENVDPVSGNPVPTGSLPEEVRDDVDAKLSQGEYVLPADVVRFFGLAQIESLVSKAKEGLAQMEAKGRIGGEQEGDLPFSAEELQAVDEAPMEQAPAQPVQAPTEVRMAEGGVVLPTDANTRRTGLVVGPQSGPINGSSSLPSWMLQFGSPGGATAPTPEVTPDATKLVKENQAGQNKAGIDQGPTGMAGSVNTWSPKDFVNYAAQRNSPVNKGIETAIGMAIPLGGLLTKARQNYLEKNVPKTMEQMLETGKDLQGNVLSVTQREDLQEAYNRIATEPAKASPLSRVGEGVKYSLGIGSSPANYTSRTASGGQSDKTATLSTNRPNQKPAITATKAPSTLTRGSSAAPSRSTSTSNQPKVSGGKPGLARGGLITKRNK